MHTFQKWWSHLVCELVLEHQEQILLVFNYSFAQIH